MKWKSKTPPKTGDTRTFKAFALFPMELDNGTTVWLEWYFYTQRRQTINEGYDTYDKWITVAYTLTPISQP